MPLARALATAALLLVLSPLTAHADTVIGSRSEKLVEREHTISMTLSEGFATLVVRRTVFNGGERHDQATFDIDLPPGAVATGLRTLGSHRGVAKWYSGELMEAEAAAEKYRELTGIGAYYPKDPALLSWRDRDKLALQVFPCAPGQHKTIEYTLILPTTYRGGQHHVALPKMGTSDVPAALITVRGAGVIEVDGKRMRSRKPIALDDETRISFAPRRRPGRLEASVASVHIDDDNTLAHYRLQAAPTLSQVPRGAYIVIVLDHSISISSDDARAQLAAAQSYLAHLPDARVQVLSFDRKVTAHHGRFVRAKQAIADLAAIVPTSGNGSEVGLALLAAEARLDKAPKQRPKRILLLTDSLTRAGLDVDDIRASTGITDAILHVGHVTFDTFPLLEVDEMHMWDAAIRTTGGLVWRLSADASPSEELTQQVLSWVRPTVLRRLKLGLPHAPFMPGDVDIMELREGEGASAVWLQEAPLPYLKLEGELWATHVKKVVRPDKATGDRWSALAFGSAAIDALNDEQMMVLAKRGKAVSPVTSYLAIEPGVRPSTEGLNHGGEGIGLGGIGTIGHGSGTGTPAGPEFDRAGFLAAALAGPWHVCGGERPVRLRIDTTLHEIVDINDLRTEVTPDVTRTACLRKAIWGLRLPTEFDRRRTSTHVTVPLP